MRIQNMHRLLGTGPLLVPTVGWPEHGRPERRALDRALDGRDWGIDSEEPMAQEREFCRLQGLPDSWASVSTLNGTVAIQLILEALNIGFGDRVIVPGLTWQATAAAVIDVNGIPVLLDADGSWTLDPALVEAYLDRMRGTDRMPKAVIAVHLMNRGAAVKRLFEICRKYGVFLIEDCAQAAGAILSGRPAMSWGVASSTSRQSSKPLGTGEGGNMVTGVPLIEARLRVLRSCGREAEATIPADAEVDEVTAYWRDRVAQLGLPVVPLQSGNYREPCFGAAVSRAQMERFAVQQDARRRGLEALDAVMPGVPGITWAPQGPEVTSPVCYRLGFEYDRAEFAGMDNDTFREVLAFLLGGHRNQKVERIYEPLNDSPHYQPLSKQRHHISPAYMRAIDPSQWDLSRAWKIYDRAVTIEQSFVRERDAAEALPAALRLMHDRAEAIVAAAS